MPDEVRVCRKCHLELPIANFTIADKARGYRKARCKSCEAERIRCIYATNETYRTKQKANSVKQTKTSPKTPAIQRRHMLKSKYDLTQAQFDQMVLAQDGKCALCGAASHGVNGASGRYPDREKPRNWLETSWRVDHCHETDRVRGLLCHKCNTRLGGYEGLLKDVGEAKLREYLTRPSPVLAFPVVVPPPDIRAAARYVAELPPRYVRTTCSVEGCGNDAHGDGLCFKHYMRVRRGKPAGPAAALPHAGSKLTDDDIRAIRISTDKGYLIAAKFGVSSATVSMIKKRRIWTHVPDAVEEVA